MRRPLYNFMARHFTSRNVGDEWRSSDGTVEALPWLAATIQWDKAHPVRYRMWRIYYGITTNPKEHYYRYIYWPIKTSWQRSRRGWADRDVWSIDRHLDEIIPAMLERLRDKGHGYPAEFSEEGDWPGAKGGGAERWNEILDTIIRGFRAHRELVDMDYVYDFERYNLEIHRPREEDLEEEIKRGMDLFVKYYSDLWD